MARTTETDRRIRRARTTARRLGFTIQKATTFLVIDSEGGHRRELDALQSSMGEQRFTLDEVEVFLSECEHQAALESASPD
jgi:hypothetical protein